MAEVLITLGIIGVVAAMTLPALVLNYQKQATATKVKKFYSMINNALQFSIAQNGDVESWISKPANFTYNENLEFMQKYFLPYIKYTKYDDCYDTAVCVYTANGDMFFFKYDQNGGDFMYFVNGKFERNSRNAFAFQFNKNNGWDEEGNIITNRINRKNRIEPYTMSWDGTYEGLKAKKSRGCIPENKVYNPDDENSTSATYCTKLLQMNDWKITDDYPW